MNLRYKTKEYFDELVIGSWLIILNIKSTLINL